MKYLNYENFDVLNGEGVRCVLWLSNCSHGCDGCFNKESWKNIGTVVTREFKDQILQDLNKPYIKGFTWSGGDPLNKRNYECVISFSREIKQKLPEKDIWLWTGYTLLEIQSSTNLSPILDTIDVLVDGKFIKDLQCKGEWFGSSNQVIARFK
jgi:anaerobic ribonucleoside-triphosphate reductase activating protein